MNLPIDPGDLVIATTAAGTEVPMRAVRPPEQGRDFPVVWLATDQEFRRAEKAREEADAIPWPLDAVRVPARPAAPGGSLNGTPAR